MERIPKTNDSVLDTLIERVERHHLTPVKEGEINSYRDPPFLDYVALTHLEYTLAKVEARSGALTDDTLLNPRFPDFIVNSQARVGTETGQGRGYHQALVPFKRRITPLQHRIDIILEQAFADAADNYDEFFSRSRRDAAVIVPRQVPIVPVTYLEEIKHERMPIDKLRNLTRDCSKILSSAGDEDLVYINVHDETRRLVTSEGTVVRDHFFGYHVHLEVNTRGGRKEHPMTFYQSLYFTDEDIGKGQARIIGVAKWMLQEIQKRKKCETKITNGLYPVLFSPSAMATQLHECFVHFLPSDEILENNSTTFGWENYQKMCTNPNLDVFSNPGMPGKWGSMEFDHEGIPAQRRPLIKGGKIVGYLADRDGAYHLSRLTGGKILPGDARIAYGREIESARSQPRISNLEVEYHGANMARSQKELFKQFVSYLNRQNIKQGIYIPDGSSAASWPEEGTIMAEPNFPYIVTSEGKLIPTRLLITRGDVHTFLDNIVTMGGSSNYLPHRCGVSGAKSSEDAMRLVRAGIQCSGAIVDKVHLYAERPEELRQPRLGKLLK